MCQIRKAVSALQRAGFGPLFVADVLDYCRTGSGSRAARAAALSIVLPAIEPMFSGGSMCSDWN